MKLGKHHLALLSVGLIFSYIVLYMNMMFLGYTEFFLAQNFHRWDSYLYVSIVEDGLFIEYCHGEFSEMLRERFRCGTAGWFPGYSYLIDIVDPLVGNPSLVGMWISKIFFALNLVLFSMVAKLDRFNTKSILLVLCFTVFFGSIYYHAVFPISQFIFFALAAIYAQERNKSFLTAFFTFLACITYSTGFILGGVMSLALLIKHYAELRKKILRISLPALGSIVGLISHFTVLHFATGRWDAFFMVQSGYGHEPGNPLKKVQQIFDKLSAGITDFSVFINIQSLLVLISFIVITFFFIKKKLYRESLMLVSFCYLTAYLLFPYIIGSEYLSLYRAESLLIPILFFATKLKSRFILLCFLLLLFVNLPMNHLFFKWILV